MGDAFRKPDGSIDWSTQKIPEELFKAKPVSAGDPGVIQVDRHEFAAVPQESWAHHRPPERLLNALHFAYQTWRPDTPDGWYHLSAGLYTRAGLQDRVTSRWAVNAWLTVASSKPCVPKRQPQWLG
ncbi:hypothetical protein [Ruegeria sp. HKCCA6837]|uniref:hypothetical protein n=1 Tax=Ruegeria sp. HKCCA6837 TaxID=2682989 RepID=UPI00148A117A|nr:hypothetical protein [Ruegeria sp. HKCCA6837]